MSLIVTQSGDNQDPSFFRNNYKEGILLKSGTEISLVSISFNRDSTYTIVADKNDRFRWNIGTPDDYELHEVVIPPGNYTGTRLAEEMELKLNESTILKSYVWTVTFDQAGFDGHGSFTITYDQVSANPVNNLNTARQEGGTATFTFTSNGTDTPTAEGEVGTNNIIENLNPDTASDNIITMNRGLFSNGGKVEYYLFPTKSYTKTSFDALDGFQVELSLAGSLSQWNFTQTTGAPEQAGWHYRMEVSAGGLYRYLYYLPSDEGAIKMSFATANPNFTDAPANPLNWEYQFLYNDIEEDLRDATAGDRTTANPPGVGTVLSKYDPIEGAIPMDLELNVLGYGYNKFGYCRNNIYQDGLIGSEQDDGFDAMLGIYDNPTRDGLIFRLSQMISDTDVPYPDPGWNGDSKDVFTNITPSTFNTIVSRKTPTNWSTFTYGDGIKITVTIEQNLRFSISVAHDDQFTPDSDYVEETVLAVSGYGDCDANIQENMYPLRPCMAINSGGRYRENILEMRGLFDDDEYTSTALAQSVPVAYTGLKDVNDFDTLGAQFVMGAVTEDDIGNNPDQIPTDQAPVPLDKFNIATTLGMKNLITFPAGKTSNSFSTTQDVVLSLIDEALIVSLDQFGIVGFNGGTGDQLRIVACIPKEELVSNTNTGTISYYAHFPIFVDLNLITDQKIYDLNVSLRNLNGELVQDIVPNTTATFVIREKEEVKQRRLMREQMELLAGVKESQNQAKITQIGSTTPLF